MHRTPIPCLDCSKAELIRLEADNKQRRKDGTTEHDLTELRKLVQMLELQE